MRPIDTHAHLQFEAFDSDREKVIQDNLGELEAIMIVAASLDSSVAGVELVQKHPRLFASIGVHPHHVEQWSESTLKTLTKLSVKNKVVAVGEVGLDNHLYQGYPTPNLEKQKEILLPQIELAVRKNLPILFHCRDAYSELFNFLKVLNLPLRGLVHCFMGDKQTAKKFLELGLHISFSGNLTYKGNDQIREAAGYVPLERLLVETDSPYLAPSPYRGQRNEPKYVKIVLEAISSLRKLGVEKITQATGENSSLLLGLDNEN